MRDEAIDTSLTGDLMFYRTRWLISTLDRMLINAIDDMRSLVRVTDFSTELFV